MNVSLTPELEKIVNDQVKSGLYGNASEVIRDCIRKTFLSGPRIDIDPDVDSPELAEMLLKAVKGPHTPYSRADLDAIAEKHLSARRQREKNVKKR